MLNLLQLLLTNELLLLLLLHLLLLEELLHQQHVPHLLLRRSGKAVHGNGKERNVAILCVWYVLTSSRYAPLGCYRFYNASYSFTNTIWWYTVSMRKRAMNNK